jgi:TolA-binding protein
VSILNFLAGIPVNANLRVKIGDLETKVAALNGEVAKLQTKNEALEKQNAELTEAVNRLTKRLESKPRPDPSPPNMGGPQGWMAN